MPPPSVACLRPAPQEVVEDLAAAHADVLGLAERLPHVDGPVGGADHLHLGHLAVHDLHWQVELLDHAQRDGAAAGLAVVHLAFNDKRLDASLGQRLGRTRPRRAAAHHRHTQLAPAERLSAGGGGHRDGAHGARGRHLRVRTQQPRHGQRHAAAAPAARTRSSGAAPANALPLRGGGAGGGASASPTPSRRRSGGARGGREGAATRGYVAVLCCGSTAGVQRRAQGAKVAPAAQGLHAGQHLDTGQRHRSTVTRARLR